MPVRGGFPNQLWGNGLRHPTKLPPDAGKLATVILAGASRLVPLVTKRFPPAAIRPAHASPTSDHCPGELAPLPTPPSLQHPLLSGIASRPCWRVLWPTTMIGHRNHLDACET